MGKYYRLNQNIKAKELRTLGKDGKQIGIISLSEALKIAQQDDLDLVEVAPKANPPVARIIDFKKFKYEEDKRERLAKRKFHTVETKEIWLSPTIAAHDLAIRLERAAEFLNEGNRVKLTVKFSGREMVHPELGREVLKRASENLSKTAEPDGEARFLGRALSQSFKPVKK